MVCLLGEMPSETSAMRIALLSLLAALTTAQQMFYNHASEDLQQALHLINRAERHFPICPKGQPAQPEDCEDLRRRAGYHYVGSGVYTVWPRSRVNDGKSVEVYCDMETDGGGWTVLQRRGNFGRSIDYFYQDWQSYKKGFGNLKTDFWLGNDNIFALSNQKQYSVRFDLADWEGNKTYALYDDFWVEDEQHNYTLNVQGYTGTAGDSLTGHNRQSFSTKDRDNDKLSNLNCAEAMRGAWWYRACHTSNLNGMYYQNGTYHALFAEGIDWVTFRGYRYSLFKTEIKIRPKNCAPGTY